MLVDWFLKACVFSLRTLWLPGIICHSGFATAELIEPISDLSPYPPDVVCNLTPQTGTLWRNSETEPYMDVDFSRPDRMAAIVH